MNLDLGSLLPRTNLKNKDCVRELLENQGFTTYEGLQNLPGRYGLPWLCENGTTVVVIEINRVIQEAADSIPTIDEAIKVTVPEPEPQKQALTGDTPVTDLEIEGVTSAQLRQISGANIETLSDLFENEEALEEVPGIGKVTKDRILQAVTEALEQR